MSHGLFRRGLTWFVRVHMPNDRWADVGRALGSKGDRRDVVRTLGTSDRREAVKRRDAVVADIRAEVDAKLRRIGLQPLAGDWTNDWSAVALARRHDYATADDRPDPADDDPEEAASLTDKALALDRIRDEARELYEAQGARASSAFWAVATGEDLTIHEAGEQWLKGLTASGHNRKQTLDGHRAALRLLGDFLKERHGLPSLEVAPMGSVTRRIAHGFLEWRQGTISEKTGRLVAAATLRRELSSFTGLWRWALRTDHAAQNPWTDQGAGLADPRRSRRQNGPAATITKRAYSVSELVALLRATGEQWAPNGGGYGAALWDVTRLGLLTGGRVDELASLRVSDLVDDGKSIRIRSGKTANAVRVIPLPDHAQRVLAARLAELPNTVPDAPLFPEVPTAGADQKRGKVLSTRYGAALRRIMKEAGEKAAGVDMHSLRRSYAQHVRDGMQEAGPVDDVLLGALMGHAERGLALRVYAPNVLPQHLRRVVDQMTAQGVPVEVRQALDDTKDQRPVMVRFGPGRRG